MPKVGASNSYWLRGMDSACSPEPAVGRATFRNTETLQNSGPLIDAKALSVKGDQEAEIFQVHIEMSRHLV